MKEHIIKELESERDELENKVIKLNRIISEIEDIDGKEVLKKPGKKRGPKRHYKKHTKKSIEKVSKNTPSKKPRKQSKSKWTPEIDAFIEKHSHLKNPQIFKMITKKFGIKTTLGSLTFHISDQSLRSNKVRAAAESSLDDDDDDELRKLPPPDNY